MGWKVSAQPLRMGSSPSVGEGEGKVEPELGAELEVGDGAQYCSFPNWG